MPYQSGSSQSPIVKSTDTHKPFYCPECQMENCLELQYGMTLQRSMENNSEAKLTSFTAAFHARILALQEREKDWQESEAAFFRRSCAWPKKSSPSSFSLKTSPQLELEDSTTWPNGLPVPAMIVDGILYPLKKLKHHICETDGFVLPTPTAQTYGTNKGGGAGRVGKERLSLDTMARRNLWPTPRAQDAFPENPLTAQKRMNRLRAEGKTTGGVSQLAGMIGGQLSPMWVEWLMGYPSGWTALKDSVIPWYQNKRKKRSCV